MRPKTIRIRLFLSWRFVVAGLLTVPPDLIV